jgi:hypothetical protein
MKLRIGNDLLTQIRGGIDQKPVAIIGADGQRRLCRAQFGMAGARGVAHFAVAIPLRNATPCRSAQNHNPHSGRSSDQRDRSHNNDGQKHR